MRDSRQACVVLMRAALDCEDPNKMREVADLLEAEGHDDDASKVRAAADSRQGSCPACGLPLVDSSCPYCQSAPIRQLGRKSQSSFVHLENHQPVRRQACPHCKDVDHQEFQQAYRVDGVVSEIWHCPNGEGFQSSAAPGCGSHSHDVEVEFDEGKHP